MPRQSLLGGHTVDTSPALRPSFLRPPESPFHDQALRSAPEKGGVGLAGGSRSKHGGSPATPNSRPKLTRPDARAPPLLRVQFGLFGGGNATPFEAVFRAYPVSFIDKARVGPHSCLQPAARRKRLR